ncbi:uncharacterized protein LOC112453698 isoform X1 [Temnothorax curvispinosus]|nr:uncharacterized protein LOC112453698 isoform X1 [Temnothorax curvispinosus]XP_024870368.1 uncharacterized protein LOC112453698 isoform X1 [Temnothorax curvispinosus]
MVKARKKKILEVKTRCVSFDEEEIFNLISIYSLPAIQNEFKKSKRHSLIYEKIATLHNMSEEYCRNAKDIQTKIKNLRSEYIKKKPKSGGTPPDDFPFYDVLHKLWSEKDIFNDELLDDSMVDDNSDDNSSNEDPEGEELLKDVEFDYSPENNSGHSTDVVHLSLFNIR